jgi:hypothetical protein
VKNIDPDNGISMFLRNIRMYLQAYTVLQLGGPQHKQSQPQEPENIYDV